RKTNKYWGLKPPFAPLPAVKTGWLTVAHSFLCFPKLEKTTHDAETIAERLNSHGDYDITRLPRKGNADQAVYEMKAARVTDEQLYHELKLFLTKTAKDQAALIYFSGHGFTICDRLGREKGYLATSNCQINVENSKIIKQENAFPLEDLDYLINEGNLSELVLLLDCCYSGNFIETHLIQKSLKTFEYKQNYYLITASRSYETAKSIRKDEHSVFSGAVIEGLSVDNRNEKGEISCDRLFDFIYTKIGGRLQTPMRMGIGGSITLVKYPRPHNEEIPEFEAIRDNKGEIVCPYQGLNVFTAEEKGFFFGRKRLTEYIKQKLEEFGVIPIIGASGSGKSSVVYAGVMAWLEAESQDWCILQTIKPGIEPLSELRRVFKDYVSLDEAELKEIIDDEEKIMADIMDYLPNEQRYFLFIDQFEEVFTVCSREWERKRFIELITDINGKNKQNLAIITTMRADFLDRCLQYQSLYEIIQNQAIYMPPLEGIDIRDIIINPAQRQGYKIEEKLLTQLVDDVGKKQGFLPLLEFALTLLWDKRDEENKVLTFHAYQELGGETVGVNGVNPQEIKPPANTVGVKGVNPEEINPPANTVGVKGVNPEEIKPPANTVGVKGVNPEEINPSPKTGLTQVLDIYAEKVYQYRDYYRDNPQQKRNDTEKEWIKLIFLRLIRTGNQEKDTRQRQPKEILSKIVGDGEKQQKALNKLIDGKYGLVSARLLVAGTDNQNNSTIDLVHEALIEGWETFKQWREENRDLRRLAERLEDQRQEWLNHPIEANLMMGGLLMQVRQQWEGLRLYLLYPQ
ncbi:MAG: caspase family protein, partial [Crocosphaera sp.]